MKVIIAGSRTIKDYLTVENAVEECGFKQEIETIISGNAQGVDKLGEQYALNHNLSLELYPAQWNLYGKSAGYKRNAQMLEKANGLIAIWDGVSVGTKNMIEIATKKGIKVFVKIVKQEV